MSASINYHRAGEGPPLLLLHGIGHHWQGWRPVIELLVDEFDVIACDSPGFGRSASLTQGIEPTITSYADAFEWFLAELGLEKPHVAGNSMGGAIALELGRRRAVSSVCALSPAGFWTAGELRYCQLSLGMLAGVPPAMRPAIELAARSRAGRIALFSQTFGYPGRLPPEEAISTLRDAWAAPIFKDALKAFSDYRFEHPEQLRHVPVTIAWGVRDMLLPYRLQAPRARRMMPWAKHVTLGAGHVPYYDDPAAVAQAIRATVAAPKPSVRQGTRGEASSGASGAG